MLSRWQLILSSRSLFELSFESRSYQSQRQFRGALLCVIRQAICALSTQCDIAFGLSSHCLSSCGAVKPQLSAVDQVDACFHAYSVCQSTDRTYSVVQPHHCCHTRAGTILTKHTHGQKKCVACGGRAASILRWRRSSATHDIEGAVPTGWHLSNMVATLDETADACEQQAAPECDVI